MAGEDNILIGQLGLDITQLKGQIDAVNKLLASIGKDSKANIQSLSNTYSDLAKNITKVANADSEAKSKSKLADLTGLYRQLTAAQNEYVRALKNGNTLQQSNWSGHISSIQKSIQAESERLLGVQMTNKEEEAYLRLLDKIQNAESTLNKRKDETNDILKRAQTEYSNLVKAQKAYTTALESEDYSSKNTWKKKMEDAENSIAALEREASTLEKTSAVYRNTITVIQQMKDAKSSFYNDNKLDGLVDSYNKLKHAQSQYMQAYTSGNAEQQNYWMTEINSAREAINIEKNRLNALNMTNNEKAQYLNLQNEIANSESTFASKTNDTVGILKIARDSYANLTEAQRAYKDAESRNDVDSMSFWNERISQAEGWIGVLDEEANKLNQNSSAYSELTKTIQQMKDARAAFTNTDKFADIITSFNKLKEYQNLYMQAYTGGNMEQQGIWQAQINNIRGMITSQFQLVDTTKLTESELEQFNVILTKIAAAEAEHSNKTNRTNDVLKDARYEYNKLREAYKAYREAEARGDKTSMGEWGSQLNSIEYLIEELEVAKSKVSRFSQEYRDIEDTIRRLKDLQAEYNNHLKNTYPILDNLSGTFTKMWSILRMIAGVSLVKILRDALNYAKEFDKAITDIALVTQKPIENVRAMGDEYRKIADDLGVTSTSIAQAASAVYRQGYTNDSDVNGILRGITKFGAVSDLSTDEALKVMTASMQNFAAESETALQTVERIGDTWSYMGDSVATNSTEIAGAMSKASASVKSVGLEFERASAYAAIMIAKTQQGGEVIGTQLNSLASRYGKITSAGYKNITSDDEGEALSFNDISESLMTAGIQMYDAVNKTFTPLGDVLDQLSEKWGTLDESQQKYISTSMAGTRGMNYFLTLMENYDEALALEANALENRGIMNEKYETWLKGVEAAQNNFKNSVESLYALLESDTLVSFYNSMAKVIDVFTAGTNAVSGFNLKLPLVASGIMLVVAAAAKLITIFSKFTGGGILGGLTALTSPGGFMAVIGTLTALVSAGGAIFASIENAAAERIAEYNQQIEEKTVKIENIREISGELDVLAGKTELSADEVQRFRDLCTQLAGESDWIKAKYGEQANGISSIGEAAIIARGEVQKLSKEIDSLAVLSLESSKDVYNKNKNGLFSEGYFNSYTDHMERNKISVRSQESKLKDYIKSTLYNIDYAGIDVLQKYFEEFDWIRSNVGNLGYSISDSTVKAINDAYDEISATIIQRNSEIENLKNDLQNILNGILGKERYSDLLYSNANLREAINNLLLGTDWGSMNAEDIEAYVTSFMDAFKESVDRIDIAQFFGGENPLASVLLQGMICGEIPVEEAGAVMHDILDMFFGMDMAEIESYIESEGYFGNAYSVVKAAANQMIDAMTEAIFSTDGMEDTAAAEEFADRIARGVFSKKQLDTFNAAISKSIEMYRGDLAKQIDVRDQLVNAMLMMGETEFENYVLTLPISVDLNTGETEEEIKTFRSRIQEELDALEIKISSGEWSFDDNFRLFQLKSLLEQIDALMANISGTALFGDNMSMDSFQSTIEKLNVLAEAYSDISNGTFDGDFKGLLEDVPDLDGMIGDKDTTLEAIQLIFDELCNSIRATADALGIALPELQDYNAALSAAFDPAADLTAALKKLTAGEKLGLELTTALGKAYPSLQKSLKQYENGVIDADEMMKRLNKAYANNDVKEFSKDLNSAVKDVQEAKQGTAEYEEAIAALGALFTDNQWSNMSAIDFATSYLDELKEACNGNIDAFHALQNAAWVNFVGTSDIDFSNLTNGLALIDENAVAVGNKLASIGLGHLEKQEMTGVIDIPQLKSDGAGGFTMNTTPSSFSGHVMVWKPDNNNPFHTTSSGGGGGGGGRGGGGGSKNTSVSKPVQTMLDNMDKKNKPYDNRLKINDLKREYHNIRGEIQGVITFTESERDILNEQNGTLEENIAQLEAEIKAKEEIMAKSRASSRAYKQAEADLEALREAHDEYTIALLGNKNRLEELEKEIENLREQARQTAIGVQDLIRSTLQAQEDQRRSMLDGTVSVEDEILNVIRARYEKEQELAVETANKKIEAIQDEISAIDDLIEERRKLIDKEEQEDEIADLEAKIARITADPTRRKELLELQKELAEKQKELAWSTYEDEMNAQKESLEGQAEDLEEYIEGVNEYYEEIFNNPQKMIEEMKRVMQMTDDEIIKWLEKNSTEYSTYTDARKEQTRQSWKDMLDQMRGITNTYNQTVSEVMQMTDAEIIAWLKKYNIDFNNATKEQQESFLKTWKETLDAWRNAYANVATGVNGGNITITVSSSGTSSGSSSSGTAKAFYAGDDGVSLNDAVYTYDGDAINSAKEEHDAAVCKLIQSVKTVNAYKDGGISYSTGLAWLDGTKSRPERVLSSYQTQLFDDLIQTLHEIKMINVGSVIGGRSPDVRKGSGGFTIEQIQVNVEKLETDADYEDMANRVGEKLKEKITKGMAIGGIII